jgi:hypothetical protein
MLDNDIRYIDGKAKHWKIGVVNSSGERRYECRVWAFGRKGPTMNISKQAIEAGAKASWENSPGYEWKSLNEIAKESERSDFAAGLTAAMPHLRGEGKQSDCNIQTKNIQSPPEIETQVEIDPYTAPREETAEEIAKRELQDIADNGLRCDTNPTIQITTSANDTALRYVEYIRRIDEGIRDRAKNALKAIREAEKRGESKTERKDP